MLKATTRTTSYRTTRVDVVRSAKLGSETVQIIEDELLQVVHDVFLFEASERIDRGLKCLTLSNRDDHIFELLEGDRGVHNRAILNIMIEDLVDEPW